VNDRAGRAVDDLNLICFGSLVAGHEVAWELAQIFLAERHRRRLAKVAELENKSSDKTPWK
jgi:ribose 5-phosphate isomerase RpiB